MSSHAEPNFPGPSRAEHKRLFRDLRVRNEYGARVADMLRIKRERRIERVIQAQRKHRIHQAR